MIDYDFLFMFVAKLNIMISEKHGFGFIPALVSCNFHQLIYIILNPDEDIKLRIDACILFLSRPSYYVYVKPQIDCFTKVITEFKSQLIKQYHNKQIKLLKLF